MWIPGALLLLVLRGAGGGYRGDGHWNVYAVLVPAYAGLALGAAVLRPGDGDQRYWREMVRTGGVCAIDDQGSGDRGFYRHRPGDPGLLRQPNLRPA